MIKNYDTKGKLACGTELTREYHIHAKWLDRSIPVQYLPWPGTANPAHAISQALAEFPLL